MSRSFKILRITLIVFCALYAAGYVFLLLRGKQIIIAKLRQYTAAQTDVQSVSLRLPFTFEVKSLSVAGQFTAKSLTLRPSFIGMLTNRILLYDIVFVEPSFVYNRGTARASGVLRQISEQTRSQYRLPQSSSPDFFFRRLSIVNGTLTLIDSEQNKDSGGLKIVCNQLNLELVNTYEFPDSIVTRFKCSAAVPWEQSQSQGSVQVQGWIDVFRRDMQARLEVKDIDGVYLRPYFSSWIDLQKAGIDKARLNFSSDITGLRNDITAVSRFELVDVQFKTKEPGEETSRQERITQAVLGMLKGFEQGNVVLNFTLKTKMDDPEFGLEPIRLAFEEKIALARRNRGLNAENVILFPGRVVTGTVQSVAIASKSLLDSLFGLGKELGSSVGASFSKEKPAVNQTQ